MKSAVILIPSYEPDENLIRIVETLKDNGYPILVVNDGSNPTFNNVFEKAKESAFVLSYDNNRGKGFALKYGYSKIPELFPEAKYVITVDGDGQHSIKDINRMHEELNSKDELVFGVRVFDKDTPFRSVFGNEWSKFSRSLCTKQSIQDDQCGLRGFPVRYLKELVKIHGSRYEYEMNQITLFQLKQYKINTIEIETIFLDQENSRSHFSPFIDTCHIQERIVLLGLPGLLCLALTMFLIILGINNGFNFFGSVILSYLAALLFYMLLLTVVYPSKKPLKRLVVESVFAFIKIVLATTLLYLFIETLHLSPEIMVPVIVFLLAFLNYPLAKLNNK